MTIYASRMNDTGTFFDFAQRPVIDLGILCTPIELNPKKLCIKLPFGTEICPSYSYINIGPLEYTLQAFQAVSNVLTPLVPFFKVLDAILSIAKTLVAVKDCLGPPPSPKPLIELLAELAPKIIYLAKQMPIFTIPLMAVNIIDMIIALLEGAAVEFENLARHFQKIQQAQINVNQAAGLSSIIGCASASAATHMDNLEHLLACVNPVIDVINLLTAAFSVSGPFPLKRWEGIQARDAIAQAILLRAIADELHIVRNKIPL